MQRVVDWLTLNFNKDESIGILKENQALQRLTKATGKTKLKKMCPDLLVM